MNKNIEGDEYINYSAETLDRQRNVRTVLLHALLAKMPGFQQLTKNLVAGKKLITGRTGLQ